MLYVSVTEVPTYRAITHYKRAAELGDKRAAQRLRGPQTAMHQPGGPGAILHRGQDDGNGNGKGGKDCVIM